MQKKYTANSQAVFRAEIEKTKRDTKIHTKSRLKKTQTQTQSGEQFWGTQNPCCFEPRSASQVVPFLVPIPSNYVIFMVRPDL